MNPYSPPPALPPQPVHSGIATASMICGFLVLPSCFATFLPAIILGHIAWSKAGREGGSRSRAKLGLIFGYGSLVLIPVIAALAGLTAPLVIRQRQKANQVECMSHVRSIGFALADYQAEHDSYPPDLKMLETKGTIADVDPLLKVRADKGGDWLYFPKADSKNADAILLISPPVGKKRVALQTDQAVILRDEAAIAGALGESGAVRIPIPNKSAE
jgi:competence protein ComGC